MLCFDFIVGISYEIKKSQNDYYVLTSLSVFLMKFKKAKALEKL
ncbi:MAG: hypothetical protein K0S01_600 [Herbinix sp.]|nr:hypothetical protein [Herbinix sp.]